MPINDSLTYISKQSYTGGESQKGHVQNVPLPSLSPTLLAAFLCVAAPFHAVGTTNPEMVPCRCNTELANEAA